jgi:hypothetical protein
MPDEERPDVLRVVSLTVRRDAASAHVLAWRESQILPSQLSPGSPAGVSRRRREQARLRGASRRLRRAAYACDRERRLVSREGIEPSTRRLRVTADDAHSAIFQAISCPVVADGCNPRQIAATPAQPHRRSEMQSSFTHSRREPIPDALKEPFLRLSGVETRVRVRSAFTVR